MLTGEEAEVWPERGNKSSESQSRVIVKVNWANRNYLRIMPLNTSRKFMKGSRLDATFYCLCLVDRKLVNYNNNN